MGPTLPSSPSSKNIDFFRLVLTIWSLDISKIIYFMLFPLQITVYFTDYSLFYRLLFQILDYNFPLNAVHRVKVYWLRGEGWYILSIGIPDCLGSVTGDSFLGCSTAAFRQASILFV